MITARSLPAGRLPASRGSPMRLWGSRSGTARAPPALPPSSGGGRIWHGPLALVDSWGTFFSGWNVTIQVPRAKPHLYRGRWLSGDDIKHALGVALLLIRTNLDVLEWLCCFFKEDPEALAERVLEIVGRWWTISVIDALTMDTIQASRCMDALGYTLSGQRQRMTLCLTNEFTANAFIMSKQARHQADYGAQATAGVALATHVLHEMLHKERFLARSSHSGYQRSAVCDAIKRFSNSWAWAILRRYGIMGASKCVSTWVLYAKGRELDVAQPTRSDPLDYLFNCPDSVIQVEQSCLLDSMDAWNIDDYEFLEGPGASDASSLPRGKFEPP